MIQEPVNFENLRIDVGQLPDMDHLQYERISKEYFWSKLIRTIINLLWITLIYFIAAYALRDQIPLWIRQTIPVLLLVWWIFSIFRSYKLYTKKAYAIRFHDINYKSGWLWQRKTTIPFNRIQHCELSSGPIDRIFDLTELHVYTAGGSHSDLTIPGLKTEVGERLKKLVLQKIGDDEEE